MYSDGRRLSIIGKDEYNDAGKIYTNERYEPAIDEGNVETTEYV